MLFLNVKEGKIFLNFRISRWQEREDWECSGDTGKSGK